jgi:hypothetical protein
MMDFKRQGIAIVLVSHNLQAVSMLCERTIYLAGAVKASGPTPAVLDAYVRTSAKLAQGADDRGVRIRSVSFVAADDAIGPHQDVASGTPLTLRVNAQALEPLDDVTFGLLIYRSTDQLLVYNGHVPRREAGPVSAFAGEFSVDLHFHAHLVRGHYYVTIHVLHNPTQEWLISPRQVATLAVRENRSRAGIADVEFSASVRQPVVAGPAE